MLLWSCKMYTRHLQHAVMQHANPQVSIYIEEIFTYAEVYLPVNGEVRFVREVSD